MNYVNIELPSKCMAYSIDPIDFKIRTLVGFDEMALSELTMKTFEKKLCSIIDGFIEGISAKDLTTGDRDAIIVWQKIQSYGSDYEVTFPCEGCTLEQTNTFDLSKVEMKQLETDKPEVTLSTGKVVKMRVLTVQDELLISAYEATGKSSWLYRLALAIEDETKDILELVEWLGEMEAKDIKEIRKCLDSTWHGPVMEQEYECPTCGTRGLVVLPFQPSLLIAE